MVIPLSEKFLLFGGLCVRFFSVVESVEKPGAF
jgi:hypothetical protein